MFGEDSGGCTAAHEIVVVDSSVVVVDEPGVGFGAELPDRHESLSGESGAPALIEDRSVEAFDHGVVVRAPWRRAHEADLVPEGLVEEPAGFPFRAAVDEHGSDLVGVYKGLCERRVHHESGAAR